MYTLAPTPKRRCKRNCLSKRDPPKSRLEAPCPWRDEGSASTLPPTFLFLQYSIVKERAPIDRRRKLIVLPKSLPVRTSPVTLARLCRDTTEGLPGTFVPTRQRRAAFVGGAYIVAGPGWCQHRFQTFSRAVAAARADPARLASSVASSATRYGVPGGRFQPVLPEGGRGLRIPPLPIVRVSSPSPSWWAFRGSDIGHPRSSPRD